MIGEDFEKRAQKMREEIESRNEQTELTAWYIKMGCFYAAGAVGASVGIIAAVFLIAVTCKVMESLCLWVFSWRF